MDEKKCSSIKHKEITATNYCPECKIYMCNKCENYHSELFQNHHQVKLDTDIKLLFTGFCKEENHLDKLEFFCKDHNKLCCVSCISKIKINGKGEHKDCNICIINDIKEEKKNNLKNNIILLEELLNTLKKSNDEIKNIYEKLNKDKEELKLNIQKIFTTIRNALNNREDFLLLEVDKKFDEIFLDQNIIKQNENLPKRAIVSLEKGKSINKEWDDENKLNFLINNCIDIENEIKEINQINTKIKHLNEYDFIDIKFIPYEEQKINEFLEKINTFGEIKINMYNKYFKGSTVFSNENNYNDYEFILKEIENRNKKIKNLNLIYRATRDGDQINNFYDKCSNIKDIILLIKSENNAKFGGYTEVGFKKVFEEQYKDNSAFVFSFDKKKIYSIKKDLDAIRCCYCCCPQFYNTIYLRGNFLSSQNHVGGVNVNYEGFSSNFELNNGSQYFKALDLEIYQILFK